MGGPQVDRRIYGANWILYDIRRRSSQCLDHDEVWKHFSNGQYTKEKSWWLLGGEQPAWSTTASRLCGKQLQRKSIVWKIHQKSHRFYLALLNRKGVIFLLKNCRWQVLSMATKKLTEWGYETLQHPLYSQYLYSRSLYQASRHFPEMLQTEMLL